MRRRHRQPKPKSQKFWVQQFRLLRFYFVTGLLVWIPLIVTVWLTWWLFKNVGLGIENLIRNVFERLRDLGGEVSWLGFLQELHYVTGMGFIGTLLLFLATGVFTRYLVGMRIIHLGEQVLARIPFVRNIYRAVQQIRDTFVSREGTVFQRVVLVEYPRKGLHAVAFITSKEQGIVQSSAEKKLVAVFLPTTPNPTSGFLLYLPPEDIVPLDITVEDAMKLIISGGAFLPEPSPELQGKSSRKGFNIPA